MSESLEDNKKSLEKLQSLFLNDLIRLAEAEELTPTDRRTIYTMLREAGWKPDLSALAASKLEGIKEKYNLPDIPAPEDEDPI